MQHSVRNGKRASRWVCGLLGSVLAATAQAQIDDQWVVFQDSQTGAECGVVNAANAQLVVLFTTGNFVVVNGVDTRLTDYTVTSDNQVFLGMEPVGFVEFADDADDLPTVVWTTLIGTVVAIDSFTATPSDSGLFPNELFGTGCDACEFIDDQSLCGAPVDGGDDALDFDLADLCGIGSTQAMIAVGFALPIWRRRQPRR